MSDEHYPAQPPFVTGLRGPLPALRLGLHVRWLPGYS